MGNDPDRRFNTLKYGTREGLPNMEIFFSFSNAHTLGGHLKVSVGTQTCEIVHKSLGKYIKRVKRWNASESNKRNTVYLGATGRNTGVVFENM